MQYLLTEEEYKALTGDEGLEDENEKLRKKIKKLEKELHQLYSPVAVQRLTTPNTLDALDGISLVYNLYELPADISDKLRHVYEVKKKH